MKRSMRKSFYIRETSIRIVLPVHKNDFNVSFYLTIEKKK